MFFVIVRCQHLLFYLPDIAILADDQPRVKAARAAGRVVQVGTHRRISPHNVSGRQFLREGRAGTFKRTPNSPIPNRCAVVEG